MNVADKRDERVVWRLTAADADAIAGCTLTDDELERLGVAIGWSSIPEALSEVLSSITAGRHPDHDDDGAQRFVADESDGIYPDNDDDGLERDLIDGPEEA